MAIVREQFTQDIANFLTSKNVTFTNSTTSGNTIIVFVTSYYDGAGNAGTPWSVDDNKSNSFTSAIHDGSGSFGGAEIFYAENINGGSSHTITVHATTVPTYWEITIVEYSGLNTASSLDQTSGSGYVAASGSYTSGAKTTDTTNELLTGVVHYFSTTVTATGDGSWSVFNTVTDSTTADRQAVQDQIVSATGSYQSSGTFDSTPSFSTTTIMATFRAPGGGGGGSTPGNTKQFLMLLGIGI